MNLLAISTRITQTNDSWMMDELELGTEMEEDGVKSVASSSTLMCNETCIYYVTTTSTRLLCEYSISNETELSSSTLRP